MFFFCFSHISWAILLQKIWFSFQVDCQRSKMGWLMFGQEKIKKNTWRKEQHITDDPNHAFLVPRPCVLACLCTKPCVLARVVQTVRFYVAGSWKVHGLSLDRAFLLSTFAVTKLFGSPWFKACNVVFNALSWGFRL